MGWIIHQQDEAHFTGRWGNPQCWAVPVQKVVKSVLPGHSCQNFTVILHKVQADVMFRLDEAGVNKQEKNLKGLLLDRK